MVTMQVMCYHCESDAVVRNGQTINGKQRYRCNSCRRSFRDSPQVNGYSEEEKELILRAYNERPSMRGLGRVFGVSRPTLIAWLKKRP